MRNKELELKKVLGIENSADLMAKAVTADTLDGTSREKRVRAQRGQGEQEHRVE